MAVEILKGKAYSCLILRLSKGKEIAKFENKENYLFNISKVDQIFNYLLKDQQIRLLDEYGIHLLEKWKNRKYCKWHYSYNHLMVNHVVFKNSIQKALKDRRFKLVDKKVVKMTIVINPFLNIASNMISMSSLTFLSLKWWK